MVTFAGWKCRKCEWNSLAVRLIDILVNYRLITKQLKLTALIGIMKALFNYAIESEMRMNLNGLLVSQLGLSRALALLCSLSSDYTHICLYLWYICGYRVWLSYRVNRILYQSKAANILYEIRSFGNLISEQKQIFAFDMSCYIQEKMLAKVHKV